MLAKGILLVLPLYWVTMARQCILMLQRDSILHVYVSPVFAIFLGILVTRRERSHKLFTGHELDLHNVHI